MIIIIIIPILILVIINGGHCDGGRQAETRDPDVIIHNYGDDLDCHVFFLQIFRRCKKIVFPDKSNSIPGYWEHSSGPEGNPGRNFFLFSNR